MNNIFSRLLISAPNGGGLFLANNGNLLKLDSLDTAGLYNSPKAFLRGVQPQSLWILEDNKCGSEKTDASLHDIHDVLTFQEHHYVVATTNNEIVKFDLQGVEMQRWSYPGEKDSRHINCLAIWNNRLIFSAFGDFHEHRGYKGKTCRAGYVQDLLTGEKIITDLSQPHSLAEFGENLILASSEDNEIREFNHSGKLVRSKKLEGYPRGICIVDDIIYVGLSRSRNIVENGINSAILLALDASELTELGRLELPCNEIYSVIHSSNDELLSEILSKSYSQASTSYEKKLTLQAFEINKLREEKQELDSHKLELESKQSELELFYSELNEELLHTLKTVLNVPESQLETGTAPDSQSQVQAISREALNRVRLEFIALHEELERQRNALETIYRSNSWLVTGPLRRIRRLLANQISSTPKLLTGYSIKLKRFLLAVRYAMSHYGSFSLAARKTLSIFKSEGFAGVRKRASLLLIRNSAQPADNDIAPYTADLYETESAAVEHFEPLVSIIVPNFNHAPYLRERLDSIYAQTYQNFEVILLDDASTDESQKILSEYASHYPEKTRCIFNTNNSGGVFHQWRRGINSAKGELIWIAESDDYCSNNFLAENVRNLKDEAVMLSFARSIFVRGTDNLAIWSTEEYLSEFGIKNWTESFKKSANWLVNHCWSQKNIIPNVSSVVFRNPGNLPLFDDAQWCGMRVCGDWVFYLHLARGGLVAYTTKASNYYRQHEKNTSVSSHRKDIYYVEHEIVAKQLLSLYKIDDQNLILLEKDIQKQWEICRGDQPASRLRDLFDLERAKRDALPRKPNLMMLAYALAAGGGETFPVLLANLLKENGYAVTLLNCHEQPTEEGVRAMLRPDIPLVHLKRIDYAPVVLSDMGIEVVHSHHAWVDLTFAALLQGKPEIAQVVSMHGMYEMLTDHQLSQLMPLMERRINQIVYTAQKNLSPFTPEFIQRKGFTRIDNALPAVPITPVERSALGIPNSAFVLCLVSRGIPEKGWEEAIIAVQRAASETDREIHLIIIGEGPEYDRLAPVNDADNIHFLGFKKNIRDYFACSDMGFIPSRFRGESFPLVLIDCLQSGKPVLASRIGEIEYMLESETGLAGALFDLDDWTIPTDKLSKIICELATQDSELYSNVLSSVAQATQKFDTSLLYSKYDGVYSKALSEN